ncbi:MAG TPA: glycosyltransferase [Bacteroidales bacterium]|nr:glycosyltransferase [Bacteroidales bacterium]
MNNEQPLVSIISPTYNHERFIADCIESVLAQTYTNLEMIIIDDGSTDNTFSIAEKYAGKDQRIRPFTQKNVGIFRLGESYNFALQQCNGKYVAVLECDDVWFPNKLEIQVEAMEKQPACVLSWGKAYLSAVDLKSDYYLAPKDTANTECFFNKPSGVFFKKYLFDVSIPALTLVIRRDILKEIGGFQQGFNFPLVDIPTIFELTMKGEFAYIDQPLGKWRIYTTQVTKTYTGEGTWGYYLLIKSFMKRFPGLFESLGYSKNEIEKRLHSLLVITFSRSGRYKLIRKDFKAARKDYIKSIKMYGLTEPVWKIRSLIGIIMSLFKSDVEWLAGILGKEKYN